MSRLFARHWLSTIAAFAALGLAGISAQAEEKIDIGPKYELTAPAEWVKKEPANRIIEFEFEIPKAEGDEKAGRVTVMGALGGVEANVERWKGQFKSDGGEVKADIKQSKVADQDVYIVEIKGTYLDKPGGPFTQGAAVERPDYRMISAIIISEGRQYFIKAYGPEKTMAKAQPGFQKMVDGLKAK